jgi:hypothetical protein
MANDAINEMISAFALGCMDKENYKQFRDYIENGGELPKGELGDLQNIVSLIPTILDIDSPKSELKNELGKRLIEIQKHIQNKEIEERRETRIEAEEEFLERDSSTKIFDVNEKRLDYSKQSIVDESKTTELPKATNSKIKKTVITKSETSEPVTQKLSSLNTVLLWGFTSLLLVATVILYFWMLDKTDSIVKENEHLASQIVKLRTDLSRTSNYINENKEFIEFFNYPNITIIQLKGLEKTSKEKGKLFISFDAGEGLLDLKNMPHIDAEKVYQLWLVSRKNTFSLGTFEITPDKKYIRFSGIPFMMLEDIQLFRITKEAKGNTIVPNGETVLFGATQKTSNSKRRRR